MMKKIAKLCVLLVICLSPLASATVVHADLVGVFTVPPNFYVGSYFSGAGASRTGHCYTGIYSTGPSYRAAVNCEMQNNAGTQISYAEASGIYGGSGVSVNVSNATGDTGRIVLFSTHDMWVGSGEPAVEYRMIESLN
jgi:hypothetical protein